MTKRIILTNKETGQVLPEATLESQSDVSFYVLFDGTSISSNFWKREWSAEYPEPPVTYRNGDVLRRKDRSTSYVVFVYRIPSDGGAYEPGWYRDDPSSSNTYLDNATAEAKLTDPDWELV